MSSYRRSSTPGASYFFTVVTHQRKSTFTSERTIEILREAFREEQQRRPFKIEAAVILPDHIHCLWKLPQYDSDFSSRWREIKKKVTRRIGSTVNTRREGDVWQRRFWEHQLRDERDWRLHMDYIHYNPVKHGYVKAPSQWPWSSFKYWVEIGAYEPGWGSSEPDELEPLNFE